MSKIKYIILVYILLFSIRLYSSGIKLYSKIIVSQQFYFFKKEIGIEKINQLQNPNLGLGFCIGINNNKSNYFIQFEKLNSNFNVDFKTNGNEKLTKIGNNNYFNWGVGYEIILKEFYGINLNINGTTYNYDFKHKVYDISNNKNVEIPSNISKDFGVNYNLSAKLGFNLYINFYKKIKTIVKIEYNYHFYNKNNFLSNFLSLGIGVKI